MPPRITTPIHFGTFLVTPQVFHLTPHSFALVNLKPLLPGHVLISPLRSVPRLSDLSPPEITDLFLTVQRISRTIQRVFNASALNIAIQDGEAAGQSVPHLHAHIIPRRKADLDDKGGTDAIYGMIDGEEGDVGAHLRQKERQKFPVPDQGERKARGLKEMEEEAKWLAEEVERDEGV